MTFGNYWMPVHREAFRGHGSISDKPRRPDRRTREPGITARAQYNTAGAQIYFRLTESLVRLLSWNEGLRLQGFTSSDGKFMRIIPQPDEIKGPRLIRAPRHRTCFFRMTVPSDLKLDWLPLITSRSSKLQFRIDHVFLTLGGVEISP